MNLGILFAVLTTICFALSAFPYTFLHKYATTNVISFWRLIFASILLYIVSILIDGSLFTQIFSTQYLKAWFWIGLSGIITFLIGDYLIFESFAVLGPAKGNLLTSLSPAMALTFGVLLLDEKMSWIGVLGIFITIAGVVLINFEALKKKSKNVVTAGSNERLAILYGALGALCLGIGIALSKQGAIVVEQQNLKLTALSVSFIRVVIPTIIFLFIFFMFMSKEQLFSIFQNSTSIGLIAAGTFFNPAAGIAFSMYTIQYMDVAVAQTFFSTSPLLSLAINIFYFKQKATWHSIVGALIAIIGVLVLIFGK